MKEDISGEGICMGILKLEKLRSGCLREDFGNCKKEVGKNNMKGSGICLTIC